MNNPEATPTILVTLDPSLYQELFTPQADQALRQLGHVVYREKEARITSAELIKCIAGCDVVITGWGLPAFTDEVLAAADRLRMIAHSGGSIKRRLPPPVFERNIVVTHAAPAIAPAVAEMALLLTLLLLRRAYLADQMLKSGRPWQSARSLELGQQPGAPPMSQQAMRLGYELVGLRVGVIGAGYTGRSFIELLVALNAEIWVYDPYLDQQWAAEMGVRQVSLDDLLANCPVVSLQAPVTEETYHMIGARELGLLMDGAALVNTARAPLVDPDALLAELKTGRIQVALDVFHQEPLPEDSPFRRLENVVLTPHIAGATVQGRHRQGQLIVDEIARFLAGEPLHYQVTGGMLATMA